MADYYISGNGSDSNAGSKASPLRSFRKFNTKAIALKPGDNVFVGAGEYDERNNRGGDVLAIKGVNGSKDKPITFTALGGALPILNSVNFNGIRIDASSYVVVDGFKLVGSIKNGEKLAGIKVDFAYAKKESTNKSNPLTNGNGLYGTKSHHITIRDCLFEDFPGGGVTFRDCDWITVTKNKIRNCASLTLYGSQGLSFLGSKDIDTNVSDYKIVVTDNEIWDCTSLIPWYRPDRESIISEGHGLMLDTNQEYKGLFLFQGNLVYNCGGAGIQIFRSNNARILNNTFANNANNPPTEKVGQVLLNGANNIIVKHNILLPNKDNKGQDKAALNVNGKQISVTDNIIYGTKKIWADAKNTTTENPKLTSDYKVSPESPPSVWKVLGTTQKTRIKTVTVVSEVRVEESFGFQKLRRETEKIISETENEEEVPTT